MIDPNRVRAILLSAFFKERERVKDYVVVHAIYGRDKALHRQRLEASRAEVIQMLSNLPPEFLMAGGSSFCNMHLDSSYKAWGSELAAHELLLLAHGLGLAHYVLPKPLWASMPGGMPFIRLGGGGSIN